MEAIMKYGPIQMTVIGVSLYLNVIYVGWCYGILTGLATIVLAFKLIDVGLKSTGRHLFSMMDTLFNLQEPNMKNFVIMMVTERQDFHRVKHDYWYKRAVTQFPRLRSHISRSWGFCCWVEQDPDEAIKRVVPTSRHLKDQADVEAYCTELINKEDPEDEFQWELHL